MTDSKTLDEIAAAIERLTEIRANPSNTWSGDSAELRAWLADHGVIINYTKSRVHVEDHAAAWVSFREHRLNVMAGAVRPRTKGARIPSSAVLSGSWRQWLQIYGDGTEPVCTGPARGHRHSKNCLSYCPWYAGPHPRAGNPAVAAA